MKGKDPDPDIAELLARTTPPMEKQQQRMGLTAWAHKAFRRALDHSESVCWRERLAQARKQELSEELEPLEQLASGGPEIIAAFCARDHWVELSDEEKDWCVAQIGDSIRRHADNWDHVARLQRHDMAPDRSCAFAALILCTKKMTNEQRKAVNEIVPLALTHPVGEVRWYATMQPLSCG